MVEFNRTRQAGKTGGRGPLVLFLLLMLAALLARFWAGEKTYDWVGPTHIAAAGNHVYVHAGSELYRLSGAGELIDAAAPDRTGLADIPIDLRVLEDGSLLLAEQDPARIRICRVESWQCRPAATVFEYLVKRQFKIIPGGLENEWLLTDSEGDTLWRLAPGGGPLKGVPDGTLAGPNDLASDSAGNLWIADTDHRRIVELEPQDDGSFITGREHSTRNAIVAGNRHFPMMLARAADNRWWVVQAAEFSEDSAGVVIYHESEGPQEVIDLPAGAYPTDIAVLGDAMLITDMERFAVYSVNSRTMELNEFGDEAFLGHLRRIRDNKTYFERLGAACLAGVLIFAALMIAAAVHATPKDKRWSGPPAALDIENAPEHVPETRRIHWLEREPKMDRVVTWLERMGFILVVFLILGSFGIWVWAAMQAGPGADGEMAGELKQVGLVLLLGVAALAFIYPVIRLQLRHMKHRLGTDGKKLYMRLDDGRELSVEPQRLFYTNQAILHEKYTFPLRGGQQKPVYVAGEVEKWLAPLLRKATRLTPAQAMKYRWKNRDGVLLWSAVAGVALAVVVIVIETISP
ncbi:MAG: hypothetical protein HKN57_07100 [Xanthomonadales bacterium]|nr:hypothetical protein [Gammaproteobacteria bacterium]NND57001.1 hypothetical protein [Xanthomonadales bacterium]